MRASAKRPPIRLAVFASGAGTNFQAILNAIQAGRLSAQVVLCVSDRPTAGALERARQHGIPTAVRSPKDYPSPEAFGGALLDLLRTHNVELIALAGYLKKIPDNVVDAYRNRILNIHPSLLPAFGGPGMYGRHVHEAVLHYGVRWTGVTVHLVDEVYDHGPIVLQEPVPVLPDDTPETLAARVLEVEHRLYPQALQLFAEGRIKIDGRRVRILPPPPENHHA